MAKELVDLELYVVRDAPTDMAILVQEDRDKPKVWLPRSEVEIAYKQGSTTIATVTMPEWLAQDKGLI